MTPACGLSSQISIRGSVKNPAAALRMSYYTGANEVELIPLRLHLAVNSQALAEKDFQELVRHDIRTIVTRKPELKPAILTLFGMHCRPADNSLRNA